MKGKVKWFSEKKGYGFIKCEDGREIFVHYKKITGEGYKTLLEEQSVEFVIEETPRGLIAVNVEQK